MIKFSRRSRASHLLVRPADATQCRCSTRLHSCEAHPPVLANVSARRFSWRRGVITVLLPTAVLCCRYPTRTLPLLTRGHEFLCYPGGLRRRARVVRVHVDIGPAIAFAQHGVFECQLRVPLARANHARWLSRVCDASLSAEIFIRAWDSFDIFADHHVTWWLFGINVGVYINAGIG